MQRVIVNVFGGSDQLTVEEVTEPLRPGAGNCSSMWKQQASATLTYISVKASRRFRCPG
jgi:hypothetical protein